MDDLHTKVRGQIFQLKNMMTLDDLQNKITFKMSFKLKILFEVKEVRSQISFSMENQVTSDDHLKNQMTLVADHGLPFRQRSKVT